ADRSILEGLNYASGAGARIVVLPLGSEAEPGAPPSRVYTNVFRSLREKDVLVFVAAGNESGVVSRPANSPFAIAVTATTLKDTLPESANRGPQIAMAAPGEDIVTVGLDGTYRSLRGTTFATAIAAGIAAQILSIRPDLGADDVESILKQTSKKLS